MQQAFWQGLPSAHFFPEGADDSISALAGATVPASSAPKLRELGIGLLWSKSSRFSTKRSGRSMVCSNFVFMGPSLALSPGIPPPANQPLSKANPILRYLDVEEDLSRIYFL